MVLIYYIIQLLSKYDARYQHKFNIFNYYSISVTIVNSYSYCVKYIHIKHNIFILYNIVNRLLLSEIIV